MPTFRTSTMRREIIMADPDWPVKSQRGPEYEFSAPGGGTRVFEASYAQRGPYAEEIDE
jgi:hypothetical protein